VYRLWAGATREVLVEKSLDIVIYQIANRKPSPMCPAREVRHSEQILPHGRISVALLYKSTQICRNVWGKITVPQPRGWHWMNRRKWVHKISKSGAATLEDRQLLCKLQNRLPCSKAPPSHSLERRTAAEFA
jgi:hypothetical protein